MHVYLTVFSRNFRQNWGMPIWIIVSLVQPIFWIFLYGQLFGDMPVQVGQVTYGYMTYFAPGMLAATTVFAALWTGVSLMMDKESGVFQRIVWTTRNKYAIALAYITQSITGVLAQSLVILAMAWALGAEFDWSPFALLSALGIVILLAFCLSSFSHVMALLLSRQENLVTTTNFITLPVLFISSILFPLSMAPPWLVSLANLNPAHHGAELIRNALLSAYDYSGIFWSILGIAIVSAVLFGVASYLVREQ